MQKIKWSHERNLTLHVWRHKKHVVFNNHSDILCKNKCNGTLTIIVDELPTSVWRSLRPIFWPKQAQLWDAHGFLHLNGLLELVLQHSYWILAFQNISFALPFFFLSWSGKADLLSDSQTFLCWWSFVLLRNTVAAKFNQKLFISSVIWSTEDPSVVSAEKYTVKYQLHFGRYTGPKNKEFECDSSNICKVCTES